jgi:hypothetical protein
LCPDGSGERSNELFFPRERGASDGCGSLPDDLVEGVERAREVARRHPPVEEGVSRPFVEW